MIHSHKGNAHSQTHYRALRSQIRSTSYNDHTARAYAALQGTSPRGRGGKELNNLASKPGQHHDIFSIAIWETDGVCMGRLARRCSKPPLASTVKGPEIGAQCASHLDHPAGFLSTICMNFLPAATGLVGDRISADCSQGLKPNGGLRHVL